MGENSEFEGLSNEELLSILQREKDIYAQLGSKLESLASENAQTKKNLIDVELEEESISNQLLKRLDDLKREKGQLLIQVEEEEEHLTNALIHKLDQLRSDKVNLENKMENEEEYITNKFLKLSSNINTEISGLEKKIEGSESIDERISTCKAKIIELKQQISNETKQNFNLEMKTRKLRAKTEKLTNENFILNQQIQLSRSKLLELKNQKSKLESNFERHIERNFNTEEKRMSPFTLSRFQSDNSQQTNHFSMQRFPSSDPVPDVNITSYSSSSSSPFKKLSHKMSDDFFPSFDDDENDFNDFDSNDEYKPKSATIAIPSRSTNNTNNSSSPSPASFIPIPKNKNQQKNVSASLGTHHYLNPQSFGNTSSTLSSSPSSNIQMSSSFNPASFHHKPLAPKSPELRLNRKRATSFDPRKKLKTGWLKASFSDTPDFPSSNFSYPISSSLPSSFPHSFMHVVPSSSFSDHNQNLDITTEKYQNFWSIIYSTGHFEFYEHQMEEGQSPRYRVNLDTVKELLSESSHSQYCNRLVLITKNNDKISIQFENHADFTQWKSLIVDLSPGL